MTDQQKLHAALDRIEELRQLLARSKSESNALAKEGEKVLQDYAKTPYQSEAGIAYGRIESINQVGLKMQIGAVNSLNNIIEKELE